MVVFNQVEFDNHEQVVFCSDKASGLKAIIAVHNTNLGPAVGGCRMWDYANDEDAVYDVLRLSKGMTYKNAVARLPFGGGKSVIIGNAKETQYNQLKREVETNRNIFNTFLSRSKETEVTSDFSSAAARFTDRAYAPKDPSKPNKKLIVILAFVASFGFAVVMTFVFDALNDTVKNKNDVENKLAQRMLGLLPHVAVPKKSYFPIHLCDRGWQY